MISRRTLSWAGLGLFLLFFLLFFAAFVLLRYVIIIATGDPPIDETDLLGTGLLALFFARRAARSRSARGRRVIVGAVLLGPPLVLLVMQVISTAWEAWLRLFSGLGQV